MIKWKESATINGLYMRDGSLEGYDQKSEIVTLDGNSPFVMELEEKVHPTMALTATIDGGAAVVLPWRMTPSTGEIAVDRRRGLVKYSSVDAGSILTVIYTPMGSVISVSKLSALESKGDQYITGHYSGSVVGNETIVIGELKIPACGLAQRKIIDVVAYAADLSGEQGMVPLDIKVYDADVKWEAGHLPDPKTFEVHVSLDPITGRSGVATVDPGGTVVDTSSGDLWVYVSADANAGSASFADITYTLILE